MQLQKSAPSEMTFSSAINELHFGSKVNSAVEQNRRADFSLLLAMFSEDVRETTPIDILDTKSTSEEQLRIELNVPKLRLLASDQSSYLYASEITNQFHNGGLKSAQLQSELRPDALAYLAENSHNLGEEVYRSLSFHTKRNLSANQPCTMNSTHLYNDLVVASRANTIRQNTA